jgi:hypothetical protein
MLYIPWLLQYVGVGFERFEVVNMSTNMIDDRGAWEMTQKEHKLKLECLIDWIDTW